MPVTEAIRGSLKCCKTICQAQPISYIEKALETHFDYLDYTYSDSNAIAKWFIWLLSTIGTTEAIQLMKEYSNSTDEGIASKMVID